MLILIYVYLCYTKRIVADAERNYNKSPLTKTATFVFGHCFFDMYYVYIHRRKDNGNIFYVGKGKGKRAYDYTRRSNWWKKIVNKAKGFIVEIHSDNLTEQESFSIENLLIKKYGRMKFEEGGILCNLTLGFDGLSGYRHCDDTKNKMRLKAIGRDSITDNGRLKIAQSNRTRVNNKDNIKKGALKRTGELNAKSKLILNFETGIFHYTLTEASIAYNIKIPTLSDNLRGVNKVNKTSLIYV